MNEPDDPVDVLKLRLARGEISAEQYRSLLNEISSTSIPEAAPSPGEVLTPPAESTAAPEQTAENWALRFERELLARGYHIDRKGNRVYKEISNKGMREVEVIGRIDGWFRWGRALGQLFVSYLLVFVPVGIIAGVFSIEAATFGERHPFISAVTAWLPFVIFGLMLWSDREGYKDYERVREEIREQLPEAAGGASPRLITMLIGGVIGALGVGVSVDPNSGIFWYGAIWVGGLLFLRGLWPLLTGRASRRV